MCLFETPSEERLKLGYSASLPAHKWIAGPPNSASGLERLSKIVCAADVAVLGACPQSVMTARVSTGKLTFITSERIWKKPFYWWRMINPRFFRGVKRYKDIANRENVHYLPMGAYAAHDVRRIGAFGNRIWNWAYFAEIAAQPPQPRVNDQVRILWVGRMLNWKRVDLLIRAVSKIFSEPAFGGLDLVGAGPEKVKLQKLAQKINLIDKCMFHEPMAPDKVRELMRQSDIYVLSSNRGEGWGVVANEAMAEGAVLIANEQAGAAPVLIDHGRTGFLFEDDNVDALANILKTLLANKSLREIVRQAAWMEMQTQWHPRVGAERLVRLSQGLLGQAAIPVYHYGPCCHCP